MWKTILFCIVGRLSEQEETKIYELSSGVEKANRKCPFTLPCHGSQAASREWLGDSFETCKKDFL